MAHIEAARIANAKAKMAELALDKIMSEGEVIEEPAIGSYEGNEYKANLLTQHKDGASLRRKLMGIKNRPSANFVAQIDMYQRITRRQQTRSRSQITYMLLKRVLLEVCNKCHAIECGLRSTSCMPQRPN